MKMPHEQLVTISDADYSATSALVLVEPTGTQRGVGDRGRRCATSAAAAVHSDVDV